MKNATRMLGACIILVSGINVSQAQEFSIGEIQVTQPWARPMPAVSKIGAVYMTLKNSGTGNDNLVAGSSPVSERVELHIHIHEDGMMMMRPVEQIEVPAGGEAALEPGGLHLMLIGLNRPMTEGEEFRLTLRFEHAGEVELTVKIGQP